MFPTQLLEDSRGYGKPLIGWTRNGEFYRAPGAPAHVRPLPWDTAKNFTQGVYILLEISTSKTVYRFFEEQDSEAKRFGRQPAQMFGGWWSPQRPSDYIDFLDLPFDLRESRRNLAVARGWNRFDGVVEALLAPGRKVYFGRAEKQQEISRLPAQTYGGGAIQFLLAGPMETVQLLKLHQVR